jgi:hypothetical protein
MKQSTLEQIMKEGMTKMMAKMDSNQERTDANLEEMKREKLTKPRRGPKGRPTKKNQRQKGRPTKKR